MSRQYEVSVPLVVTIGVSDDPMTKGEVTVMGWDLDEDFSGYRDRVLRAHGVWDSLNDEWGGAPNVGPLRIRGVAWEWVNDNLPEPEPESEPGDQPMPESNHVQHPMIVAYHTLYDFKDTLDIHSSEFMEVDSALASMTEAMHLMGITPPEEPQVTTTYTITATFDGNAEETWDEWTMWLTDPSHLEEGTTTVESEPDPEA